MCWQWTPAHSNHIPKVNIAIKMLWDKVNISSKFT
jgi:hypothetical protein